MTVVKCDCGCSVVCDEFGRFEEPYISSPWFKILYNMTWDGLFNE